MLTVDMQIATMDTATITTDPSLRKLRLMQLISPSLPVGAFTYSQGLEWAVETQWVTDKDTLKTWIQGVLDNSLYYTDIPLLKRFYAVCDEQDLNRLHYWSNLLIANRETLELRQEEHNRGRALIMLLKELSFPIPDDWRSPLQTCQLSGYAYAAVHWQINLQDAALGYLWGWLENIVLSGVKLIPLGQTAGQQLLAELSETIPVIAEEGLALTDEQIGASCSAMAIASSLHETQYTRLFRS